MAEQRQAEIETLKPKAALADALLKRIEDANTAKIAKIPEAQRKLVPDGLDPIKLSEWLDAAAELLTKPATPDLDSGRTGDRNKPDVKASAHYKAQDF